MSNHKNQKNFIKLLSERTSAKRNSTTPKAIINKQKPNRLIAEQLQKDIPQVSSTVILDFLKIFYSIRQDERIMTFLWVKF